MDKRSGLALTLCFVILIGWMWLYPKFFPSKPPTPAKPPEAAAPADKPADPGKSDPAKAPAAGSPASYAVKPDIKLESKFLEATVTNRGAGVKSLVLHYPKPGDTVNLLQPYDPAIPHLALRQIGGEDAIESAPWEIVDQTSDRVEFRYRLRSGVEISKILALDADRHTIQMTLLIDNKNKPAEGKSEPAEVPLKLEVVAFNGLDPDSLYRYENYLTGVSRYDRALKMYPLPQIEKGEGKIAEALKAAPSKERDEEVRKLEEEYLKVIGGRKEWLCLKNRFFAAILSPDNAALDNLDSYLFRLSGPEITRAMGGHHNIVALARTNDLRIGGSRKVMTFTVYGGPLEKQALQEIPGAEEMAGYTGGCILGFIVKPAAALIMEMLHWTSMLLHNMGLGIIVTTLLIRLCLFPLSLKSQRNALQMQLLAPKIQALKERYKDDQQKYGIEQMRLFKENKVNPVAGCLPLFIQMPIFIGMYSVFEMSIELRHAPFFGWIRDLSEPDRLFGPWKPFDIPLLITTLRIDAFNLLPILMTITWFLQAYFTPRSPDPQVAQQQKMMMYMPIVFGLTCYGLASGLSLYFLANSLLSMGEQKIIKKYILKIGPDGKPLARDSGPDRK